MIRLINRIAAIIFILVCFISFVLYHDDMDIEIPFIKEIFIGITILLGVLFVIKTNYRWQALLVAKKAKLFFLMSKGGMKKAVVYELINLGFYLLVALALIMFAPNGFFIGLISLLFLIEGSSNLLQNFSSMLYRTIVQENAVTIINNYITVIPWKGLIRIESRYNDIRFIDELNKVYLLDLDMINEQDRQPLIEELKRIAYQKNLYFDVFLDGAEKVKE